MVKKNQKLVRNVILLASALALLMATTIAVLGITYVKKAYYESFQEELHAAAVMMRGQIEGQWDGEWSQDADGVVYKGKTAVHDVMEEQMDGLHKETGISFTFFYGDTRYVTSLVDVNTNKKMEGTQASNSIVDLVLSKGQEHLATNFEIGGQNFYAYYLPVTDVNGDVVGMMFAGRETASVDANIAHIRLAMIMVYLIFAVINTIVAHTLILRSDKAMKDILSGIQKLEDGRLSFYIDEKTFGRKDELGVIAESSAELRDKLQDVIHTTIDLSGQVTSAGESLASSADTAAHVANQVTDAVEEISKGAVSQAENVEFSLKNTEEMGSSIDDITNSVESLSAAAVEMQQDAEKTVDAINELMAQNESVMSSMDEIHGQIQNTNNAVLEIAEASNIITSISEQTNLLSLNASIEAARAGEQGKGFAVVASEIGALATQSKEAAVLINKIVNQLVDESQRSVDTIENLNSAFEQQNNQLNETKSDMDGVVVNVTNVDNSAQVINDKVHMLNKLKESFNDIIEELSAISQQNAASSQETNASMEELNATFAVIADASEDLRDLAEALNDKMNFFSLEAEA